MRFHALAPLVRTVLGWILLGGSGCAPPPAGVSSAASASAPFAAPQGLAVHDRWVIVASSAFERQGLTDRWGDGFVTLVDRATRTPASRIPTSQRNPGAVAVAGDRAYVVNAGTFTLHESGLATATSEGGLDVIDLRGDAPPSTVSANLILPLSAKDGRIGGYGSIAISPDGRWAYLGSGTRGDVFQIDLAALELVRGPDDPIALFDTPPGENGLTSVRRVGEELIVLNFNTDELCSSSDWAGGLAARRCHPIGVNRELLEGPIDAAGDQQGRILVLMSIANAIYRVDSRARPFGVEHGFAGTGLATNRIATTEDHAFVVNSSSNNLQRIQLESGASTLPFTVFPERSNPYELATSVEREGLSGWVTLFGSNALALVQLETGEVLDVVGPPDESRVAPSPGTPPTACDEASARTLVGIENVVSVRYGPGAGRGQAELPGTIRGGPTGAGERAGAVSGVLSLGAGGEIVVDFGENDIVDGPGPDFLVFENPFLVGPYAPFSEPALVAVSATEPHPERFVEFPCNLDERPPSSGAESWPFPGCAGVRPVLANVARCDDATDVGRAGGDAFDLADVGLARARYVRLRDAAISPSGDTSRGFDLDAIVLLHHAPRH